MVVRNKMLVDEESELVIPECCSNIQVKRVDNRDNQECCDIKPNVIHGESEVEVIEEIGLFEALRRLSMTGEGSVLLG